LSLASAPPVLATVLHVPGDYATIQAAIDAAVVGDIVEVACGTYAVPEIIMKSGITLRSETGEPECVQISPLVPLEEALLRCSAEAGTALEGMTFTLGRAMGDGVVTIDGSLAVTKCNFVENYTWGAGSGMGSSIIMLSNSTATFTECVFHGNFASSTVMSTLGSPVFLGCEFTNNDATDYGSGAAFSGKGAFIDCLFSANMAFFDGGAVSCSESVFQNCTFAHNTAGIAGGAAVALNTTFDGCVFYGNSVGALAYGTDEVSGGAITARSGCTIVDCTFWGNDCSIPLLARTTTLTSSAVAHGSAIVARGVSIVLDRIVVAANTGSEAIYCQPVASVSVTCTDIFGNPYGDWVDCIAGHFGMNGNVSVDPMFCDAASGDFHLSSLSPCLYAECGVMGAFGQGCFDEKAALYQVLDVGNDQGRQVRLTWQRSLYDSPTANPYVTGYAVYRKKEQFASTHSKDVQLPQTARGEGVAILGWDYLGTVPSRGDSVYETVAPTLCDSTITGGQCLSTFFISAMTTNPFVYYDSPPTSGYSKDNVAPPTPTGFVVAYNTGSGNHLEWEAVAAADFAGFNIYRATQSSFTPASGTLVATTTQTSWTDPNFDGWNVYYEVAAFDIAGNESSPSTGGTTTTVPLAKHQHLELFPNVPNPFNPTTSIPFTIPFEAPVRVAIYDARGSLVRVLVDKTTPAGHYDAVWDGRDAKGSPVGSGVYLCRLEHQSDIRTRKIVLIK
jgi:hypothetical protein